MVRTSDQGIGLAGGVNAILVSALAERKQESNKFRSDARASAVPPGFTSCEEVLVAT